MTVNLWAYGDESGIEGDGPYCVVAGFIGSPKWWDSFNEGWGAVLKREGVEEFHAKQFFGRQKKKGDSSRNPFDGWPADKATRFLSDLLSVIRMHRARISHLKCSLSVSDFFSFSWGERRFITGGTWNHPTSRFISSGAPTRLYHVPAQGLLADALDHAKPSDCKVHFVLDEQSVMQEGFAQIVQGVRGRNKDLDDRMGGVTWDRSLSWPGIQAADMLAHLLFSNHLRRDKLDDERRYALVSILGERWRTAIFTREKLDLIIDKSFGPDERTKLRAVQSPSEIQKAKATS